MNVAPSSRKIYISHVPVTYTCYFKRKNRNTVLKVGYILKLNMVNKISPRIYRMLSIIVMLIKKVIPTPGVEPGPAG